MIEKVSVFQKEILKKSVYFKINLAGCQRPDSSPVCGR